MLAQISRFRFTLLFIFSITALTLASCWVGGSQSLQGPRIYQLSAATGTFANAAEGAQGLTFEFALDKVSRDAFWFSDRPLRASGSLSMDGLINNEWPNAYGAVAPNALIRATIANLGSIQIFGILDRPVYNPATDQLRFSLTYLNGNQVPVANLTVHDVQFIILNNDSIPQTEEWSQLLTGKTAQFEASSTAGTYTFRLTSANPDISSYTSAPSRKSTRMALADYLQSWRARFGSVNPSVSVSSVQEDGSTALHFLILSDPVLEKGGVSFSAQALSGSTVDVNQTLTNPIVFVDANEVPPTPAGMRTLLFTNSSAETIWVGGSGIGLTGTPTGFELPSGSSKNLLVPDKTKSMAFWPRTNCVKKDLTQSVDGQDVIIGSYLSCMTGDCFARGFWSKDVPIEQCNGGTRRPPVSALEIDFGQGSDNDFWDLTNVDGWSMGMSVIPMPGRASPISPWDEKKDKRLNCGAAGAACTTQTFDMKKCPEELRSSDGKTCLSISKAAADSAWQKKYPQLSSLFYESEAKKALMGCTCSTSNPGITCETGGSACLYGCSPLHLAGYDAYRPGKDTDWFNRYPGHGGFCDYRGSTDPSSRWPTPDQTYCRLHNVDDKECTYEKGWCKSVGILETDCNYPDLFKSMCPDAYSFQYNDNSSTFQCKQKSDYVITFTGQP